ncbi:related to alpha-mannosidase IC (MNSIC) [Cephalotrichum gorgonifer]|uniref:alpha-1,2-Mannosidase n=1 Tax=Cephalotrichum gorgonifer TaxID=2041049 RepID=A0AAE8MPR3_9PEZI|nr:related to alpha-mannosidase IC (MNSIC) [Cephalotrichum gorgonifer]
MPALYRRKRLLSFLVLAALGYLTWHILLPHRGEVISLGGVSFWRSSFDWSTVSRTHPVHSPRPLPAGPPLERPQVQHDFDGSGPRRIPDEELERRRNRVRDVFVRDWASYTKLAWKADELRPVSGRPQQSFGGWAATLVDSLDTLWIMDLKSEFDAGVRAVATLDWSRTSDSSINVFETTIRHLGGLLAAYDLSGEPALLAKAEELGDMLYMAFDTPNGIPPFWLDFSKARRGTQRAGDNEASAAMGSLTLEFTRLSQLTGRDKYFDAIDRVKDFYVRTQNETLLPGMWPVTINFAQETAHLNMFTLGGRADSLYEYFPKEYLLLGGLDESYKNMTLSSLDTARDHLLFRPMIRGSDDILFAGRAVVSSGVPRLVPESEHLTCFAGGMYALAGKVFGRDDYVTYGEQLARGSGWAYASFPTGVMPEIFELVPCGTDALERCEFDEERWETEGGHGLKEGFKYVTNSRYLLRPEAIEAVFYVYRITGKEEFLDLAWTMFEAIDKATETPLAHSAIADVKVEGETRKMDSMESFWFSETLKYFYLIFSPTDVISLDDWVLNTEAHPFKLPKAHAEVDAEVDTSDTV